MRIYIDYDKIFKQFIKNGIHRRRHISVICRNFVPSKKKKKKKKKEKKREREEKKRAPARSAVRVCILIDY